MYGQTFQGENCMDDIEGKSMDSLEMKGYTTSQVFSETSGYGDLGGIVSPRLLKSIYQSEDWIYILVDKIASKLAQIPWQVHRETMKQGEHVLEPALNHPVQNMLENPNPLQSSYSFKYALITDHTVTGNALIYFATMNRWLVQVPTEIVQIDVGSDGNLAGYRIVGIDPNSFPTGSKLFLQAADMIHVKRPNSSSVFWGLSPLIPGANPSLFNRYSNEYLLNYYKKGAQPGMVLEMTEEANEAQAKKLLNSLETAYTGRANQRRGMLLPKGLKVVDFNHTLADQQLIDYIRNNRETLINIFGVPKHELSIADAGSLGSEEYKTALKNFWQGPLMSIGSMFESALTMRLKPLLGQNFVIRLNYTNVPILQEDLKEKADVANSMLSTMTYNEVRQRIWKLPAITGGDTLRDLRQPSLPTFGGGFLPPKQEPQQLQIAEKAAPTLKESNFVAFGEYLKSDDSKWIRESKERLEDETKKSANKLEKRWLDMLETQMVEAVKALKKHFGEKAIPNKRKLRRDIEAAMDSVQDEWESGYVTDLAAQIELGYDSVLEVPFNEQYKDGIEAIRARNEQKRRETLVARGIDAFDQISKTTSEKIMSSIEKGLEDSKSIAEIAKDITAIGANAAGRAFTIARTEAMIANSIGQAAAVKDAAEVIPNLVKVWLNLGDERVRGNPSGIYKDSEADHWSLGLDVVEYADKFANGLSYPRDTSGPAGEVINCRCTMLAVSEDDLPKLGIKR
jgi:HK97 family phage portal protein